MEYAYKMLGEHKLHHYNASGKHFGAAGRYFPWRDWLILDYGKTVHEKRFSYGHCKNKNLTVKKRQRACHAKAPVTERGS